MANATSRAKSITVPWTDDKVKRDISVGTAASYYMGTMIALNSSGAAVKCDDTANIRFDGIFCGPPYQVDVATTDTLGDKWLMVERPFRFAMKIAAVAVTDIGSKVYALYDNEVALSGTSNSIFVGYVDEVVSSTMALIRPAYGSILSSATFDGNTLTFTGATGVNVAVFPDNLASALAFQEGSNKYLEFVTTNGSEAVALYKTLTLPVATGTAIFAMTDNLADACNFKEGANSYLKFTTTNSSEAVVIGQNTTLAGTFTITSASAAAVSVGRLGATTPALLVDASTATSITGFSIKSAASGGGVALAAIGETNVATTLDAKGSGTLSLNSVGTGGLIVGSSTGRTLVMAGTLTAGGLVTCGIQVGTAGPLIYSGSGAPSISAAVKGSLYLRSDGSSTSTRAYIASDNAGTWTAITTAA